MTDLSVIIPARNEEFLQNTIDSVLKNMRGDTELLVFLDGYWPIKGIPMHSKVNIIHHGEAIGQRASVNKGAKLSTAKYIMKLDAHCDVDEGFDVKLMADCEYDWVVVPRMYNLHAFNWQCKKCGLQVYQGPYPTSCEKCNNVTDFEKVLVWQPRWNRRSDFARFDKELHFQYWRQYEKRQEAQQDIADLMCSVGACFFMHRERFLELGGVDEEHGSWGQFGVEIACKAWLSGGRQVVNKKTWFSHLFRTQKGFGFPYPISGRQIEVARDYSRDLWINDKWPLAKRKFAWLLEHFKPVPEWHDPIVKKPKRVPTKGIVYYTDNQCEERIAGAVRLQLLRANLPITCVSRYGIDFGKERVVVPVVRSALTMFNQILTGLESAKEDIIFLAEHDVLYPVEHFRFTPSDESKYYYNEHVWKVDVETGQALFYATSDFKGLRQTSGLCAYRDLLIEHYRKRIQRIQDEGRFTSKMGFEPGKPLPRGVDNNEPEGFWTDIPLVDFCHKNNFTPNRFKIEQFRNKPTKWILEDSIPHWGVTKGQVDQFIRRLIDVISEERARPRIKDEAAAL